VYGEDVSTFAARYPGKDVVAILRFTNLSPRHSPGKISTAVGPVLDNPAFIV